MRAAAMVMVVGMLAGCGVAPEEIGDGGGQDLVVDGGCGDPASADAGEPADAGECPECFVGFQDCINNCAASCENDAGLMDMSCYNGCAPACDQTVNECEFRCRRG